MLTKSNTKTAWNVLFLIAAAACFSFSFLQKKTFKIKGTVLRVPSYCGGVHLTDEMFDRIKPYPYINKKFYAYCSWNFPCVEYTGDPPP